MHTRKNPLQGMPAQKGSSRRLGRQAMAEGLLHAGGPALSPHRATLPPGTWGLVGHHVSSMPCPFFLVKITMNRSHSLLFIPQTGSLGSHWDPPSFATFLFSLHSSCVPRSDHPWLHSYKIFQGYSTTSRLPYYKILTSTSLSVYVINIIMVCVPF